MNETKVFRDSDSSAVISTDVVGLNAYKVKREQQKKINKLETDINTVKQELSEIKNLLKQIITTRG